VEIAEMTGPIVLASASPRREALLALIGLPCVVAPPEAVAESSVSDAAAPGQRVESAALAKARAVAADHPGALVMGADTMVVVGDRALGKPASPAEAAAMLRALSGRTHQVYTALALIRGDQVSVAHEVTEVTMRKLDEEEIAAYVATGEPRDKAGAYGIQGKGALLISGIRGDYYNVVGLPLARLGEMLSAFGVRLL
jgi:septum formation protein